MTLRILHISTRLILGGSQENTVLSCEGQARLGHEVHLAFGPIYGPEGSLLERVEKFRTADGRSIKTHVIPSLVREVNPLRDRAALGQVRRLIRDVKPEIVHTHSSKAGILGRAAAWSVGHCGIVHTIHGPPFMPVDGGAVNRLKRRVSNWVYALAERHAARRCHVIVSVADAMTRTFLARGIGRAEQYVTVPSGMETGPFLHERPGESRDEVRAELGLARDDLVIGTIARLAEHKGHDDLLDALARDLRSHPNWKLLWVGDGWWRERLMRRVESLGLTPQVLTTGLVPPERIPGLVRAMDILAHPSYREGLPRTVPQALLCGVVPIAYDADGTKEACIHGETGWLVRVGDRAGLREGMRFLAGNPEKRREMAERGRAMCAERFSAEFMVAELEKVYARVLELSSSS